MRVRSRAHGSDSVCQPFRVENQFGTFSGGIADSTTGYTLPTLAGWWSSNSATERSHHRAVDGTNHRAHCPVRRYKGTAVERVQAGHASLRIAPFWSFHWLSFSAPVPFP